MTSSTLNVDAGKTGLYSLNSSFSFGSQSSSPIVYGAQLRRWNCGRANQLMINPANGSYTTLNIPTQVSLSAGGHIVALQITESSGTGGTISLYSPNITAVGYNSINATPAATGTQTITNGFAGTFSPSQGNFITLSSSTLNVDAGKTGLYSLNSSFSFGNLASTSNVYGAQLTVDGTAVGPINYVTLANGSYTTLDIQTLTSLSAGSHTVALQILDENTSGQIIVYSPNITAVGYNSIATPEPRFMLAISAIALGFAIAARRLVPLQALILG